MNRTFLLPLLALVAGLSLDAQPVRLNYRSGGLTHTATEAEPVTLGSDPCRLWLERVGFPGGDVLYRLFLEFDQKTPVSAPKGVKLAAALPGGGIVRVEQIGTDPATKRRLPSGRYRNRLEYAVEPSDLARLQGGVTQLDIVTGWEPDDYMQIQLPDDTFSRTLAAHASAVAEAFPRAIDLSVGVAGYSDAVNSTMITAEPVVVQGENHLYQVILTHLRYKDTGDEDLDFSLQVGLTEPCAIAAGTEVVFVTSGGGLPLLQTHDDVNFVYLYPSLADVRRLCAGVDSVRIPYEGGVLEDRFPDGALADALNRQYQTLMSLAR